MLPLADPPPLAFPACPPTDPRNRSLPYHRATPRTDSPSPDPPASRPTPLRFARLRSLSLSLGLFSPPTAVPVAALCVPPLSPWRSLPLPRDARRHHPLRATSTPESHAALWNTTGSPAIIFCPIICRARVYACERTEMGEPKKGRVENDHLEAITKQRRNRLLDDRETALHEGEMIETRGCIQPKWHLIVSICHVRVNFLWKNSVRRE